MTRALGYIRRSRVYADAPGAISEAQQTDAVRALARRHGHELGDGDILRDWGKSGGAGKEEERPAYQQLKAAIASGQVSAVFCFDLSRLTRSIGEWADLASLCAQHEVSIVAGDQTFDFRGWQGKMVANILASVAEGQRERDREKARDLIARRRRRGDRLGAPAYGVTYTRRKDGQVVGSDHNPDVVVAAFREAGTFQGAAALLNERGVPPASALWRGRRKRKDGTEAPPEWRATMVRRVCQRTAPGEVPAGIRRGSRAVGRFALAGLVWCSCGGLMTCQKRPRGVVILRCARSYTTPGHPSPRSVSEARILPLVMDELEHLQLPADRFQHAGEAEAERAAIRAERARLAFAFARDALSEEAYTEADDALAERLEGIDTAVAEAVLPSRDAPLTDAPPEVLNALLRRVFAAVRLDPAMRGATFTWRVPEWRAA